MEKDEIWRSLKDIGKERNLICHGVWFEKDTQAYVFWHKMHLVNSSTTRAEVFDFKRLDSFVKTASLLLNTFAEFKKLIETLKAETS